MEISEENVRLRVDLSGLRGLLRVFRTDQHATPFPSASLGWFDQDHPHAAKQIDGKPAEHLFGEEAGVLEEFPQLAPHDILKRWLYIDSRHEDFEQTMEGIAKAIACDDQRFGIHPQPKQKGE
jgi:hypothetical protein